MSCEWVAISWWVRKPWRCWNHQPRHKEESMFPWLTMWQCMTLQWHILYHSWDTPSTLLYHEWMTWEGIKDWTTCQERLLAPLLERCPVLLNRANWAQDFHKQGSSMWWTVWFKRLVDYTRNPWQSQGLCMLQKYDELWRFTMICHKYMDYTLKEVNLHYPWGSIQPPPIYYLAPIIWRSDIDTRGISRDV